MARPVIGITAHTRLLRAGAPVFEVGAEYALGIHEAGGLPLVLPILADAVADLLDRVDGLVISGGGGLPRGLIADRSPTLERINPPRYAFERALITGAAERELPVLGICRGMQMIGEPLGGRAVLNIATDEPRALSHYQRLPGWQPAHEITIELGSALAEFGGAMQVPVNSFHRQAVASTGDILWATAHAPDGIIEAIEGRTHRFLIGVQFHPEKMLPRNERWMRLFRALVAAAQTRT